MSYLDLVVMHNIETNVFEYEGDVRPERRADLIMEFIRTQIGAGADPTPANEVDVYKITLRWYPDGDRFATSHNCGNLGLRDGILLEAARRLRKEHPNG